MDNGPTWFCNQSEICIELHVFDPPLHRSAHKCDWRNPAECSTRSRKSARQGLLLYGEAQYPYGLTGCGIDLVVSGGCFPWSWLTIRISTSCLTFHRIGRQFIKRLAITEVVSKILIGAWHSTVKVVLKFPNGTEVHWTFSSDNIMQNSFGVLTHFYRGIYRVG